MANNGSIVRKDLHDLSKPIEIRELNRQLDWIWKQLLGGLTLKSLSSDTTKKILEGSVSQAIVEQLIADRITANTIETKTLIADSIIANNAKIGILVADEIRAGSIDANFLYATLAEMMVAKIGVAKIDYAQVVDMFSERIFTDAGIAGKFRIDGLEVTQAQIVDLIVSSFRLVSDDGKVYKVSVDTNGEIVTEYLEDQDDWMKNGKIPDGYAAVASSLTVGNVTSGDLYVSGAADVMKLTAKMLIADEAWIRALASDEILANFLMANTAFVNLLRTSKIVGDKTITMIAQDAAVAKEESSDTVRVFRQEEFPNSEDKVKPRDMLVIPSTGQIYQAVDLSDLDVKFYLDENGDLTYTINDSIGNYRLEVRGYDLYAENFMIPVSDDGTFGKPYAWELVRDLELQSELQEEIDAQAIHDGENPPDSPEEGKFWLDRSVTPNVLRCYTGGEWETVNDLTLIETVQDALLTKQAELEAAQRETALYLRLDGVNKMVRIGQAGVTSEFRIDAFGSGVAVNEEIFSRFEANRVLFGNMEIRRPAVGGLAFDSIAT